MKVQITQTTETTAETTAETTTETKNQIKEPMELNDQMKELKLDDQGNILDQNDSLICIASPKSICVEQNIFGPGSGVDVRAEYLEDGTVMRMFWYENAWRTATNNTTDASCAFWKSHYSFEQLFYQVFSKNFNFETLDKQVNYFFVLNHRLNSRVVKFAENHLVYIGCSSPSSQFPFSKVKGVKQPKKIDLPLDTTVDLESFYVPYKRGVLITIGNNRYHYDFKLYKNGQSIAQNYYDCVLKYISTGDTDMNQEQITLIDYKIQTLQKVVFSTYNKVFKQKNMVLDKTCKYYNVLKRLHRVYLDRKNSVSSPVSAHVSGHVTFDDVVSFVENLEPQEICWLTGLIL